MRSRHLAIFKKLNYKRIYMKYIMAHDMGTSSDKAVLIDFNGNIVASKAVPYPTYYPAPAFVEQEPDEYWDAVCLADRY